MVEFDPGGRKCLLIMPVCRARAWRAEGTRRRGKGDLSGVRTHGRRTTKGRSPCRDMIWYVCALCLCVCVYALAGMCVRMHVCVCPMCEYGMEIMAMNACRGGQH